MARRNSRSKNDSDVDLGCLFAIFSLITGLLLALFSSGNPRDKKIGWGIIGAIVVFFSLASVGVSGEGILAILVIAIVIIGVVYLIKGFFGESNNTTKKDNVSLKSNSTEVKSFDEQFKLMEKEIQNVYGKPRKSNVSTKLDINNNSYQVIKTISANTTPKEKYYGTVSDAIDKNLIPADCKKIMIVQIQRTDVTECPGLIWIDDNMLYVLPLLLSEKVYSWPLTSIPIIIFQRESGVSDKYEHQREYNDILADEFRDYLPKYVGSEKSKLYTGKFILPVGLEVTNASGKELFDLLHTEFHVIDDITNSTWYVKEIKELYKKYILLENGVINIDEYCLLKEKYISDYRICEKNDERYRQQIEAAKEIGLL